MKVNITPSVGVYLRTLNPGDVFVIASRPEKAYMKISLKSTSHVTLNDAQRQTIVECDTGDVKAWMDCTVFPVNATLVNSK